MANNTLVRSGVLAFPISDAVTPGPALAPGRLSSNPFPVTVGGSFGVAFSVFSNLAGIAIDDDGSAYFQQIDLTQFTGGNIVKITGKDGPGTAPFTCPGASCPNQDRSPATNGFLQISTLVPSNGQYGTASGPQNQVNVFTNYSGPSAPSGNVASTFFGNVISLATGAGNVVYAGVARSFNPADSPGDQATEGLFQNPAALGPTPSMIITLADAKGNGTTGTFDSCSAPSPFPAATFPGNVGVIPVGDGIADPAAGAGTATWEAFVLGNGPDTRATSGTNAIVFGTPTNTLKLDLQIDYSVYSVDQTKRTRMQFRGARPVATTGFKSRRDISFNYKKVVYMLANYFDFRGDLLPNPPVSGGNTGDGDSDRFDHVFYVAPIDPVSLTPVGLAGLSHGFLRYTNRLAPTAISPTVTLGQTAGQPVQGDDDTTTAPISLARSQSSGGGSDDQTSPFTGDDNDSGGQLTAGAAEWWLEFNFANPVGDVFS
jgi:hypothetical protein